MEGNRHLRGALPELGGMKRLFVVRHGKAVPYGSCPDVERVLTPRGEDDATALGKWTLEAREAGTPFLVSPAARTRQTATLICTEWGESHSSVHIQEDAYLASDRAWLNWINAWEDRHEAGWIVGHNPGLSELVERLTEQPVWLPTCGLAEIELQVDSWAEAFAGTGRLRGLFTPKSFLCP